MCQQRMMEKHLCLLTSSLTVFLCFSNQVKLAANEQSVSMVSLEPPDFPDMMYYFQQSLFISRSLHSLVTEAESVPEMPCICHGLSHINWTRYSERPAREWLDRALMSDCTVQSSISPPVIGVGNWTLESKPRSSGMVDQGKALVIGISAGLTIALSVCIILVLCRKQRAAGQAVCQGLPAIGQCRTMILRQHSDCQQMVSVPQLSPPLSPTESVMSNYHYCPHCCHTCIQMLLSWCSFLTSCCKIAKLHPGPDIDGRVELHSHCEFNSTSAVPGDNGNMKWCNYCDPADASLHHRHQQSSVASELHPMNDDPSVARALVVKSDSLESLGAFSTSRF